MKTSHVVVGWVAFVALMSAVCSSSNLQLPTDSGVVDHQSDALQLPATLESPPQPDVACSGSDTSACTLPSSTCAVDKSCASCSAGWIVYYQTPRCVLGRCVWDEGYFQCQNFGSGCANGGCLPQGTTTAVPIQ